MISSNLSSFPPFSLLFPFLPLFPPPSLSPFLFFLHLFHLKLWSKKSMVEASSLFATTSFLPKLPSSSSRSNASQSPISASKEIASWHPQAPAEDALVSWRSTPHPPPLPPQDWQSGGSGDLVPFPGLSQRADSHYPGSLDLLCPLSSLHCWRVKLNTPGTKELLLEPIFKILRDRDTIPRLVEVKDRMTV